MTLPAPVPRSCPVCDGRTQDPIHDHRLAPIDGVSLHAGYRVVACGDCGMVYADGIPAQEAFDLYYQSSSRYEDTPRLGLPSTVDRARFEAIASELSQEIPPEAAIAEIGTATGGLLAALKDRGYTRLLGMDPSPLCGSSARELHGLDVAQGTVFDPFPGGPRDVVIAVGVVEHIRDLDRALANLAAALDRDGLLYLEVPDLEGFYLTNEAPFQEFSTEHINFFTRRSLGNLMARFGFQPAFGRVAQRVHSGGSTMQVLAWAFRRGEASRAPDPAGPAAARAYRDLCLVQAAAERDALARLSLDGRPIAVWGAGTAACRLMATPALASLPIAAFLDSNLHLQGRTLGGVPIHPPQWLRGFQGPILVASRGYAAEIQRAIREDLGLDNPVHLLP